jgi:hypothetical protein
VSTVGWAALLDLKALLRCTSFPGSDVVLQGQHRSLVSPGGADAKITKPTESRSIQTVSSTPEAPVLAVLPPETSVQVAANPRKSEKKSEQKGKNSLPRFATSCRCLAGCVGSGKF